MHSFSVTFANIAINILPQKVSVYLQPLLRNAQLEFTFAKNQNMRTGKYSFTKKHWWIEFVPCTTEPIWQSLLISALTETWLHLVSFATSSWSMLDSSLDHTTVAVTGQCSVRVLRTLCSSIHAENNDTEHASKYVCFAISLIKTVYF